MMQRILALLVLLLLLPLLIVFVVGIQFNSPGSVFFLQSRVGLFGRPFHMWKLRTMVPNAEARLREILMLDPAAQKEWAQYGRLDRDPRVAGVFGRLARKFSVDEIPQLINVIKGEMALVGPRPIIPGQFHSFPADVMAFRQSVLPGMTGLWQVCGRSDTTLRQMIRFDLIYARRRSFGLDVLIFFKTFGAVLRARGAY